MESIFLKREDIARLKKVKYDPDWVLYRLDNDTLLKCFNVKEKSEQEKALFLHNKGNKLNYVFSYDMPENNFKALVFVDGRLVGYTFENVYKQGYRKIANLDYKSKEKKLDILKRTREHLNGLHEVGIIYGNIIEDNILYNPTKKKIILANMDDARIKDFDFDVRNAYITEYLKHNTKNPMLLDSYMFNIETIAYLDGVFYPSVLDYLRMGKMPDIIDTCINRLVTKNDMLELDNSYAGNIYIDSIKKPSTRKRTK